jgi:hypothetical protein
MALRRMVMVVMVTQQLLFLVVKVVKLLLPWQIGSLDHRSVCCERAGVRGLPPCWIACGTV